MAARFTIKMKMGGRGESPLWIIINALKPHSLSKRNVLSQTFNSRTHLVEVDCLVLYVLLVKSPDDATKQNAVAKKTTIPRKY